MTTHNAGVILNGVTGRMGTRQHLIRSILAIREQGGVQLNNGDVVMPDPILVGRNEKKLAALAEAHSLSRWTTDLSEALQDEYNVIYFDSQTTDRRQEAIKQAIAAGKHM
jgi:predicted dehydrogenase